MRAAGGGGAEPKKRREAGFILGPFAKSGLLFVELLCRMILHIAVILIHNLLSRIKLQKL